MLPVEGKRVRIYIFFRSLPKYRLRLGLGNWVVLTVKGERVIRQVNSCIRELGCITGEREERVIKQVKSCIRELGCITRERKERE